VGHPKLNIYTYVYKVLDIHPSPMDEFTPREVYTNLLKMFEYRDIKLTSERLDSDTLAQRLSHYYFVIITGTRPSTDPREHHITVVLLAPNSNFASKSGEFKRLLSKIKIVEGDSNNIMFVAKPVDNTAEPLTKYIEKKLVVYRAENPNVYVETRPYFIFEIEVPRHVLVPLHVVMSATEVDDLCTIYSTSKEYFPRISVNDSMAVWLGLRPGDVVKICRPSETAGTAIAYRMC